MGVGIIGDRYRWPRRTIPVEFEAGFPNPKRVVDAIRHWHDHTGIRFVPRSGEADHVLIARLPGRALSDVGCRGGRQKVQLGDGTPTGNVIHELGHVVGLWHEHCRDDRDDWVEIDFENISEDDHPDFMQDSVSKVPTPMTNLGDYDFGSIMHYRADACALYKEKPVIKPKAPLPPGIEMGQRVALSAGDVAAVEILYAGVAMPTEAANAAALTLAFPTAAAAPPQALDTPPQAPATAPAPAAPPPAAARPTAARRGRAPLIWARTVLARLGGRLWGRASTHG